MPAFAPHKRFLAFIRREPALAALLAASAALNVYAFTFPTWNPDYLVQYAWNARGLAEWNHGAFYYGSLHINLIKILIIWPLLAINWVWPVMTEATIPPQTMALYIARWLAAAMGAGCVGWTWGIARRLAGGSGAGNRGAGVPPAMSQEQIPATSTGDEGRLAAFVAAFGLATTPLVIALAHFTTADMPSLFWALGGLYFLLRHAEEPERRRWWLLAAVFIGLTASTKYVGALFGAGAVVWLAGEMLARRMTPGAAARRLAEFAGVSLAVFALGSFEMWFYPAAARENIMVNVRLNRQFAEQAAIGFIGLPRHLPRAVGWAWLALGAVGAAAALVRRGARGRGAIILAAAGATYVFFGAAHYYPFRYVLPLLPPVMIFAGAGVAWGLEGLRGARALRGAVIAALAGLGILLALRAGAAAHQFAADTRLRAAAWLAERAAPGDRVAMNKDWFLYYPALPPAVEPFDLKQAPPAGWRVGDALAATGVRWVVTTSLLPSGNQAPHEREFYAALARGESPYAPAATFTREATWLHDPRSVEFLNPAINVYELSPAAQP